LLAATTVALSVHGAAAGVAWCRTDPAILVDGVPADIFVSAPIDAPLKVTGPTEIVVSTPVGIEAVLIAYGVGFGKGEVVSFDQSRKLKVSPDGIELRVEVFLPASDDAMPVLVEFAPRVLGIVAPVTVEGTANDWISLRAVL
jgi:hypothetical protein